MLKRFFLALACLLPASLAAWSADVPTFEARVRSVNDLLGYVEYLAPIVGQEEAGQQIRGLVQALATEKEGFEGLDLKRPFGAYAFVKPDVVDSPFVLLIPIADEARALRMLKDRLEYTGEAKDGVHSFPIPRTNEFVRFRFANGYVNISLRTDSLEPKALLKPEAFFAKDDGSAASLALRLDQLPEELKKMLFGQLELRLNDDLAKQPMGSPAERKLKELIHDGFLAITKSVFEDGKEFTIRLRIEPKSDDIILESHLTAKPGTPLAKSLKESGSLASLPAAIFAERPPVLGALVNTAIPAAYQARYAERVEVLTGELIETAPESSRELAKRIAEAIVPTLKSGAFDVAAALVDRGVIAAVRVKESKPTIDLLKALALFVPSQVAKFEFDRETVEGFTVHRVNLAFLGEAEVKRFGSRIYWIANSADHIVVSLEDSGDMLKKTLAAKKITSPMLDISLRLGRLLPIVETALPKEEVETLVTEVFGREPLEGRDTIRFRVTGDGSLTAKLELKGKAIRLAVRVDEAKKPK